MINLALGLFHISIINDIYKDDTNQWTTERRQNSYQNYLICGEQMENIISSRINQLDCQENNHRQQITISNEQNQIHVK